MFLPLINCMASSILKGRTYWVPLSVKSVNPATLFLLSACRGHTKPQNYGVGCLCDNISVVNWFMTRVAHSISEPANKRAWDSSIAAVRSMMNSQRLINGKY